MAAYVVVDICVNDPVRYEDYKKLAAPTVAAFGGRCIVRGGRVKVLEGDVAPNRTVLLEFPTLERACEWWDSDLYRPIRQIRWETAVSKMLVVEGA